MTDKAQCAEREQFEAWSNATWKYNLRPANPDTADTYMEGETETAWMFRKARAALKAQPAPTEAPNFCARCGKRLAAGSIHTCTPPDATEAQGNSNSPEIDGIAAQGEDSARLDAERYRFLRDSVTGTSPWTPHGSVWVVRYNHQAGTIPVLESAGKGGELDRNVDAARVSAETGGGKP